MGGGPRVHGRWTARGPECAKRGGEGDEPRWPFRVSRRGAGADAPERRQEGERLARTGVRTAPNTAIDGAAVLF